MAVFFWHIEKWDSSSVRYCTRMHWKSLFAKYQKNRATSYTWPCVSGTLFSVHLCTSVHFTQQKPKAIFNWSPCNINFLSCLKDCETSCSCCNKKKLQIINFRRQVWEWWTWPWNLPVLVISIMQPDQVNMVVMFWYLVQSDASVRTASHPIQGTRNTRPCLTSHPVYNIIAT